LTIDAVGWVTEGLVSAVPESSLLWMWRISGKKAE